MSLRWILDHKEVTTVIPGASSPKNVSDNARVSSIPALSKALMDELNDFYKEKVHDHIRGVY